MNKGLVRKGESSVQGRLYGSRPVNYHLRLAKNIERKMMGEAFSRLSSIARLSSYKYVGFGSEFFNDFSLFHQSLGIVDMVSIERDGHRIDRCKFNRPYGCIEIHEGTASDVLPKLSWEERSIVWLDYTEMLSSAILDDISFLVSRAKSGSALVWSVNAHPWDDKYDEATGSPIKSPALIELRRKKLRDLLAPLSVPDELQKNPLGGWGLAQVFYTLLASRINTALEDRNAAAAANDKLRFEQIFHFRYADGLKMLTVGGLIINSSDKDKLGENAFEGLSFVRTEREAMQIEVPVLTSREIRFLSQSLPHSREQSGFPSWLSQEDIDRFRKVYRYYPVFSESEL